MTQIALIDFDESMASSISTLIAQAHVYDQTPEDFDRSQWEFHHKLKGGAANKMWEYFRSDGFTRMIPPVYGCIDALNSIKEQGITPIVVTDRRAENAPAVAQWCKMYGLGDIEVVTTTREYKEGPSKEDFLAQIIDEGEDEVVLIVEDSPHHLLGLANTLREKDHLLPTLLLGLRYPYNAHVWEKELFALPVDSWAAIARMLKMHLFNLNKEEEVDEYADSNA